MSGVKEKKGNGQQKKQNTQERKGTDNVATTSVL